MKKSLVALAAILLLPLFSTPAHPADIAKILEGVTDPRLVAGVSYNNTTKQWAAVLTANIVGPRLGDFPCYVAGVGVGLNTIAPGLEEAPIAAWSVPLVTCNPFGEQVTIQVGTSTPLNGPGDRSYYLGLGTSVGGGPNTLQEKRVARAKAKQQKALLKLQDEAQGRPAPTAGP